MQSKLTFLILTLLLVLGFTACVKEEPKTQQPNVIVILADDLGYGDLSCFGSPTIKTPQLDKLANEGQKWTSFYSAANICTPSRTGLLTGRLPIRSGMCSNVRGVLFPDSEGGLPDSEITIAEILKGEGYHTACIGKWHLGVIPKYSPLKYGFDYFFGLPYSNDMELKEGLPYWESCYNPSDGMFQVALMEQDTIVEKPVNQHTITRRYTEKSVQFIRENKDHPFFLYLAQSMPHVPLFRSKDFIDKSDGGIYGDVIEEIDWSIGQILKTLKEEGLDKNTLVVFTSDNGPWAWFKDHGGSAGPLRGSKSFTWEGGNRVPAIYWMPGTVKKGTVTQMGASVDLLPTICSLVGAKIPDDRMIDGKDVTKTLETLDAPERENFYFYKGAKLIACRHGKYKLHFFDTNNINRAITELYDLEGDPGEKYNLAEERPELVQQIRDIAEAYTQSVKPVVNQLELGWKGN